MADPFQTSDEKAPRLSTARAYVTVVAVFAAFFGAGVISAGESLTAGIPVISRVRWVQAIPQSFTLVVTAAVGVTVTILLGRSQGRSARDLGWRMPARSTRRPTTRLTLAIGGALVAIWAGSIVTAGLATGTNNLHARNLPAIALGLSAAANAAFLEESIVLSFVVVTLVSARRPLGEVVAVAVLLRMTYHIFYGPGVAGIAVWALAFCWIFLRTNSLVPLVVAHGLWDIAATLSTRFAGASAALVLLTVSMLVVGLSLMVIDRPDHKRHPERQRSSTEHRDAHGSLARGENPPSPAGEDDSSGTSKDQVIASKHERQA